jgi:hypothetical protein
MKPLDKTAFASFNPAASSMSPYMYHNGGMHHHHSGTMGGGFVPAGPPMGMSGVGMGMGTLGLSGPGSLGLGSAGSLGLPTQHMTAGWRTEYT